MTGDSVRASRVGRLGVDVGAADGQCASAALLAHARSLDWSDQTAAFAALRLQVVEHRRRTFAAGGADGEQPEVCPLGDTKEAVQLQLDILQVGVLVVHSQRRLYELWLPSGAIEPRGYAVVEESYHGDPIHHWEPVPHGQGFGLLRLEEARLFAEQALLCTELRALALPDTRRPPGWRVGGTGDGEPDDEESGEAPLPPSSASSASSDESPDEASQVRGAA